MSFSQVSFPDGSSSTFQYSNFFRILCTYNSSKKYRCYGLVYLSYKQVLISIHSTFSLFRKYSSAAHKISIMKFQILNFPNEMFSCLKSSLCNFNLSVDAIVSHMPVTTTSQVHNLFHFDNTHNIIVIFQPII